LSVHQNHYPQVTYFLILILINMLTIIYLLFKILIFSIETYYLYKFLFRYNKIILIIIYFSLLWIISELFNQIHIWLRNHNIFLELGHASLYDILILLLFHIVGIILICFFFYNKKRSGINKNF